MNKKLTNFDKIQRALFSDAKDSNLTPVLEKVKERYMKAYTFWVNNPSLSDNQIVRFLTNECEVNRAQAYKDLRYIKRMLGNVTTVSKEWVRHTVSNMATEAYRLAKLNKDPKAMTMAADKLIKCYGLDKPELDQFPWDQLVPPNFEPSPDISVLGFKPDPNIEERRRKMREKYLQKYYPNAISDAEIVED